MHPRVFIADKLLLCTWFPERQAGKDCLWFGNGKHAFRLLFLHNCSEMCLCGGCLQAASPPERIITVSVEACGRRMRRRLGRRRRYFGGGVIWCLYKSALCACQAFFFCLLTVVLGGFHLNLWSWMMLSVCGSEVGSVDWCDTAVPHQIAQSPWVKYLVEGDIIPFLHNFKQSPGVWKKKKSLAPVKTQRIRNYSTLVILSKQPRSKQTVLSCA